jgi:hypothetical protein
MNKDAAEKVISGELTTGSFTLQAQMPGGKTVTMSGYIYASNTLDAVNKQVDFMHDVLDRQRVRAEIPELEAKLDQRNVALGNLKDAMAGLEKKRDNGGKLSSAEKKMIDDMNTNIFRVIEDIKKGEEAIATAKKAVNRE